jgi:hypothetical protein
VLCCAVQVHPDLPDVRLTPEVVTRTQQRLLCLFGGAQPKQLGKKAPKVVRRLRVGTLRTRRAGQVKAEGNAPPDNPDYLV